MTLYRDDMSYLDITYGVTMTPEHKVEINYPDPGEIRVAQIGDSIREIHWFIEQLCETVTRQEKQIETLSMHLKDLSISLREHIND